MNCIFCKIVAREIPANVVAENEHALAFHDVNPVAPTHVLVIPKRHIASVHDAGPDDVALLGQVMLMARDVADKLGLGTTGYRLVTNTGHDAKQSVFHWHVHVLGGRGLDWPPG
jgi:histidine triad (HIT) family protein